MYAPSPARTTTRISVEVRRPMSAPLPPREDAGREHQSGDDEDRQQHDAVLLIGTQRQAAIFWLPRTYRDQIFLLRQPVHRVQEEVAVTRRDTNADVGDEIRVADRDDARFGL